ncbi:hypothetical protein HNY73_005077 [Argiope bruennichi]|uniref:Peptidase A9 domain-containing protein n=1 Tax=Argiope bruennichi TaxID=94029 RepID=A0A8T0FFA2_ARGBR|nr:hypothetical protein HNY73_005077 [Argiope bruennichi]
MADSGNGELLALLAEMKKSMESGQEEMKKEIREHVEVQVEGMKEHVNECIGKIEGDVESVKKEIGDVKEEVDNVQGEISVLEKRLCDLEERPINSLPSSEVMYSRPTVKLLTFDGQTSWSVFKTEFDVVSSSNGWTDRVKASQLVASLRGSAAEVLQGIPAGNLTDLRTVERALESQFGGSHITQFYRTEDKTAEAGTNLAHKLKQQFIYTAPNISLTTATGEKANIHGKLDASIECGSRRFQHKIYVADITDPCILGLDFLREFNFTVELERNEILTGGEEIPLFSANVEFLKLCSAFSKEKTVIPAGSECLVRGVTKFSEQFRYAVTNSPNQISEKDVLVAATLVDLKKETIPVRVLNVDNKPKTMDKGAVIASYEPVVDIVARPQEFSGKQPIQSILENIEGLNEDQRIALQKLFQEFQHLFSTCDADVGRCNVTQHKINTGDHPPIKQYPRRLPLARKKS